MAVTTDGPGCMLNQYGECVSMREDGYNIGMDFQLAQQRNLTVSMLTNETTIRAPQAWHFPAGEAMYCSSDDAKCGSWMEAQRFNSNQTIDSRYCVGTSSCIAISVCEASRSDLDHCIDAIGDDQESSEPSFVVTLVCALCIPLGIVAISLFYYRCCKRDTSRTPTDQPGQRQQNVVQRRQDITQVHEAVAGTRLDLAGWRVEQAERVEREKLRLAGAGDEDVAASPHAAFAYIRDEERTDIRRVLKLSAIDDWKTRAASAAPGLFYLDGGMISGRLQSDVGELCLVPPHGDSSDHWSDWLKICETAELLVLLEAANRPLWCQIVQELRLVPPFVELDPRQIATAPATVREVVVKLAACELEGEDAVAWVESVVSVALRPYRVGDEARRYFKARRTLLAMATDDSARERSKCLAIPVQIDIATASPELKYILSVLTEQYEIAREYKYRFFLASWTCSLDWEEPLDQSSAQALFKLTKMDSK
ncbi:hypothetical protein ATCC90586_000661 [Pythium insidiosum]|nr:hypothetical protein ATCC90586_000661 [Pythium insidiosum]